MYLFREKLDTLINIKIFMKNSDIIKMPDINCLQAYHHILSYSVLILEYSEFRLSTIKCNKLINHSVLSPFHYNSCHGNIFQHC